MQRPHNECNSRQVDSQTVPFGGNGFLQTSRDRKIGPERKTQPLGAFSFFLVPKQVMCWRVVTWLSHWLSLGPHVNLPRICRCAGAKVSMLTKARWAFKSLPIWTATRKTRTCRGFSAQKARVGVVCSARNNPCHLGRQTTVRGVGPLGVAGAFAPSSGCAFAVIFASALPPIVMPPFAVLGPPCERGPAAPIRARRPLRPRRMVAGGLASFTYEPRHGV
jgi:hypothetical protein